MKNILKKVLIGLIVWGGFAIASPVEQYGALKIKDRQIVGQTDEPVALHGVSLFWSQWRPEVYNPRLIKWLAQDWKISVIRAAMGVEKEKEGYLVAPGREKNKIRTVVEAAIEQGIYVIIDWHDHQAENHQAEAVEFFSEMARTYGKYPNVIYEIYNEPLRVSWTSIRPYSEAVIKAIREHDPDNLILAGTPFWSQNVDEAAADPLIDGNTAYVLHFYPGTHGDELKVRAQRALDRGVTLFVSEFGTSEADGGQNGKLYLEETQSWLEWLDERHISWVNWSVTDKREASAILEPGASLEGEWFDEELSESGKWIREQILQRANSVNTSENTNEEEKEESLGGWFKSLKKD